MFFHPTIYQIKKKCKIKMTLSQKTFNLRAEIWCSNHLIQVESYATLKTKQYRTISGLFPSI